MKLKPEIKELWVNALESGDYTQTTGCLRDVNGHCCLGVLTELAVEAGVLGPAEPDYLAPSDRPLSYIYPDTFGMQASILPNRVRDWAFESETPDEWLSGNPSVRYNNLTRNLSDLNDDIKLDFTEIAAVIKEQL